MTESKHDQLGTKGPENTAAKIVAEMPVDKQIQANLQEQKENDGFPGSCGSGT